MSYTFKPLANEPIMIAKFVEPFAVVEDGSGVAAKLQDVLNTTTGTIYYIADMSDIHIAFSDLVVGLASAYSDKSSPYTNPRLKTFTVGSDDLIAFGTKAAAEQQQYGKAAVKLYSSLDEAMVDIRQAMRQN